MHCNCSDIHGFMLTTLPDLVHFLRMDTTMMARILLRLLLLRATGGGVGGGGRAPGSGCG